jgi:ubiquinone/menaquinone biosynthesis C-methylase UbiE
MANQGSPPRGLGAERVNELSRNFWNSAVLQAGIRLGIFPLLERQALTSAEIATQLHANPRFVEAFLEACTALDLLERQADSYANSSLASAFLVPGKEEYVGDLVLHITNYWSTWGNLDRLVREGRTELPFHNGYVNAPTYWHEYMMGQHNRAAAGQAAYLVRNVDLSGRRKLLDLGGGAASYSIALAQANPGLTAYVVDAKEPLETARQVVDQHGLQARVLLVEGDFRDLDLGNDSDAILISGVVLIRPEAECRELFRRVYDALTPGGLAIVQDFMRMDDSPKRRFLDTMMDLYVLVGFDPGAGDRPGAEVASWLADAGFTGLRQIPVLTHLAIITAEKPMAPEDTPRPAVRHLPHNP